MNYGKMLFSVSQHSFYVNGAVNNVHGYVSAFDKNG